MLWCHLLVDCERALPPLGITGVYHETDLPILKTRDGRYFRVGQGIVRMVELMDGRRNACDIASTLTSVKGRAVSPGEVLEVRARLEELAALCEGPSSERPLPPYLSWGFTLLSAARVERVARIGSKILIYPIGRLVAVLLLAIAVHALVFRPTVLQGTFSVHEVLLGFVLSGLSVLIHELGHASALLAFGGRPGRIGGGIYLIFPVMFADVTDAWILSRGKRIGVNLAGVVFEWIYAGVCCLMAYVLGQKEWVVASILVALRALFNLNPFIRSDGYWILSDAMGLSNLMGHSRNVLFRFLKGEKIQVRPLWKRIFLICYGCCPFAFLAGCGITMVLDFGHWSSVPFRIFTELNDWMQGSKSFDRDSMTLYSEGLALILLARFFLLPWILRAGRLSLRFKGGWPKTRTE